MTHDSTGQAGAHSQLEITSEMIEAGVYAAKEHCLGLPLEDLVHSVYLAMWTERHWVGNAERLPQ